MFGNFDPQPADNILEMMQMFRDDPRAIKTDLGVGVYRDENGTTPVFGAVKAAEAHLLATQDTKSYTSLIGEPAFRDAMIDLVLAQSCEKDRIAAANTPGGTGAVRQALDLIRMADDGARVWVSAPTWPNHVSMLRHLKMPMAEYRYFDGDTRGVSFDAMMDDLAAVQPGDVVLLHGCCHNPTGANLNPTQWATIADFLIRAGAIPFVDIAYQGFGDGLEQDAEGVRLLAERMPEMLIAASCSKNFGIYRERTGILIAIAADSKSAVKTQSALAYLNRQNFSFPPDHGARLVSTILTDAKLRANWAAELDAMRQSMLGLRQQLSDCLRVESGSDRFGFLASHRGMFSRLGATPDQVLALREKHGIYMIGDSRMNIAGLSAQSVPVVAKAIVDVGV